jgi:LysM repeat protein
MSRAASRCRRLHALGLCLLLCAAALPARADRGPRRNGGGGTLELVARRFDREAPPAPESDEPEDDESGGELPVRGRAPGLEHRVAERETLGAIAAHYGVSVEQILERNPGLAADHIRAGQTIVIGSERAFVRVVIQQGDTLTGIARAHEVSTAELMKWNPGLSPDRIRAGRTLTLFPKQPLSLSESKGSPSSGELVHGHRLPPGAGYTIRDADRSYATDETVHGLIAAFEHLLKSDPHAPRLSVHDLSLRHGGPMNEHRSHQSGRDADVAYPQKSCARGMCDFHRIGPEELDPRRAFELLRYLLERDQLEAVFIDYRLQAPLYRYAREHGATAEELQRWFQYPHGRDYPLGVIRHFPKHDDHMHLRFACPANDNECKTFRPLMSHTASR